MDNDGFIEKESKRIKLIEETIQNVQSYEALLDPTITEQYCFTDEWGATGDCVMMDKRNNVFNCRYTRGVLDGEMIVARYDELIGVFTMKNGRITNERPLSELKRNRMLDLDANNEICWEGDVLEDKPFGWGEAFDAKNRLLYVGFRIGDQNVCYGTTYYPDTGTIAYLGNWCRGKRWGFGHCYDRSGALREEGIWMNDALVKSACVRIDDSSLRLCGLHSVIASLAIGDGCCERSAELCLRHYQHLHSLSIGRGSFAQAHTLVLQYLPALERVVVGEDTFACLENCVFESESANTPFPLGLPRFSTLRLGRGALRGNGTVSQQQSSVPPFNYKNTLLLCDLPALRSLEGAGMNFVFFGMVVFERAGNRADLGVGVPAVQTVRLGDDAFKYVFRFQAVEASRLQECVLLRAQFLYLFVKDSLALPALQASLAPLAAGVECVRVADFSGNAPELRALDLSGLERLQTFATGLWCFHAVRALTARGLPRLRELRLGRNNCVERAAPKEASGLWVEACPALETVVVGAGSAGWFQECVLAQLPELKCVAVGDGCFAKVHSAVLSDLPALEQVTLGEYALNGDALNVGKKGVLLNSLSLWDLPSLAQLACGEGEVLFYIGRLRVRNVPMLREIRSFFALQGVHTSEIENAPAFQRFIREKDRTNKRRGE